MGVDSQVDGVSIWNRSDCCGDRLSDITIDVLAEHGSTVVYSSDLLNPGNVDDGPDVISQSVLGQDIVGRFVRVTRTVKAGVEVGVVSPLT